MYCCNLWFLILLVFVFCFWQHLTIWCIACLWWWIFIDFNNRCSIVQLPRWMLYYCILRGKRSMSELLFFPLLFIIFSDLWLVINNARTRAGTHAHIYLYICLRQIQSNSIQLHATWGRNWQLTIDVTWLDVIDDAITWNNVIGLRQRNRNIKSAFLSKLIIILGLKDCVPSSTGGQVLYKVINIYFISEFRSRILGSFFNSYGSKSWPINPHLAAAVSIGGSVRRIDSRSKPIQSIVVQQLPSLPG